MAEKLQFTIEILGSDQQREKLGLLERQLLSVSQRRNELMKKQKEGTALNREEVKELGSLTVRQRLLSTQKQQLTNSIKQQQKAVQGGTGSMAALRVQVAKMREEANKLNLTTKAGQARFKELSKEIDKGATTIRNFDRKLSGSRELVGEYSRGIKNAFRSIAGAIGVTFGAAGAIRLISTGVNTLREFDKGVRNILTLLNEADRAKFGDVIKEGSTELIKEFGFAAEDVNKALFDAVSAGVPAGEAIAFMNENAKLAVAGVTDLGVAVDGTTSILNAYQLATSETEKVTAAFFSAQKYGKITVAQLSEEVGSVAPIAKQADVSYQELLTTYAVLTSQGIHAAEATTAIKASILAVINPSEQAKKTFESLGIETGLNAVRQQGLFTILKKVSAAAQDNADALTELIPNVRALTGLGALGEAQLKKYDEWLKIVNKDYGEGSSIAQAFELQMVSLDVRIRKLQESFKHSIAEGLAKFLDWSERNIKVLKNLGKVVLVITGAMLAYTVAKRAAIVVQATYNGVKSLAIGILKRKTAATIADTAATEGATIATKALNTATKASPWGLILGLITTVAASLLLFRKRADAATMSQKDFNDEMQRTFDIQAGAGTMKDTAAALNTLSETAVQSFKMQAEGNIEELSKTEVKMRALIEQSPITGLIRKKNDQIKNETSAAVKAILFSEKKALQDQLEAYLRSQTGMTSQQLLEMHNLNGKYIQLAEERIKEIDKINKKGGDKLTEEELKKIEALKKKAAEDELKQLEEAGKKKTELFKQEFEQSQLLEESKFYLNKHTDEEITDFKVKQLKERLEWDLMYGDITEKEYETRLNNITALITDSDEKQAEKRFTTKQALEKSIFDLSKHSAEQVAAFNIEQMQKQLDWDILYTKMTVEQIEIRKNAILKAKQEEQEAIEKTTQAWMNEGMQISENLIKSIENINDASDNALEAAKKNFETDLANAKTEEEAAEIRKKYAQEVADIKLKTDQDIMKSRKDAYNDFLDIVKKEIKAKLAEAIAGQLAKVIATIPFPINIIIAAGAGAVIGALFEKLVPKFAYGKSPDDRGYIVQGEGSERSDTILARLSPREAVINAYSMKSPDVLSVTGTPMEIASQINSYKGYGRPFAFGGLPAPVTTTKSSEQFIQFAEYIVKGINNKRVTVSEKEITNTQKRVYVSERISAM